jgi:hypothetical protein
MFDFLRRKAKAQAQAAEAVAATAQKDFDKLVRQLAQAGDLSDRDAARLEECEAALGIVGTGVEIATDLRDLAAAKAQAAPRERLEADAAKAAEAVTQLAEAMEAERKALAERHDAARAAAEAKATAALTASQGAQAAWERQQKLERKQWRILGLPDPEPAERAAADAESRRAHLSCHTVYETHRTPRFNYPVIFLEEIMLRRKVVNLDAFDFVPALDQTERELNDLQSIARRIVPGNTYYVFEPGVTFTPLLVEAYGGRSNLMVDISTVVASILNGSFRRTVFIPVPGVDPGIAKGWDARIAEARKTYAANVRDGNANRPATVPQYFSAESPATRGL